MTKAKTPLKTNNGDQFIKGTAAVALVTALAVTAESVHYGDFEPLCIAEGLTASLFTCGSWIMFDKFAKNAKAFAQLPSDNIIETLTKNLTGYTLWTAFKGTALLFSLSLATGLSSHLLHNLRERQQPQNDEVVKSETRMANNRPSNAFHYSS